jgi:hypothetical protein
MNLPKFLVEGSLPYPRIIDYRKSLSACKDVNYSKYGL